MFFTNNYILDTPKVVNNKQYTISNQHLHANPTNKEKYILYTQHYVCNNKERYDEYYYCLQKNIENNWIEKIIILFETKDDIPEGYCDLYKNNKVRVIKIIKENLRRISFNEIFRHANYYFKKRKIIVSNNDIYYDDTLQLVQYQTLEDNNEAVCLTRTNVFETGWEKHSASQDTFIFVAPVPVPINDIYIGWISSDNLICGHFYNHSYNISNPTQFINAFHYHRSPCNNNEFTHSNIEGMRVPFTNIHEKSQPEYISLHRITRKSKIRLCLH